MGWVMDGECSVRFLSLPNGTLSTHDRPSDYKHVVSNVGVCSMGCCPSGVVRAGGFKQVARLACAGTIHSHRLLNGLAGALANSKIQCMATLTNIFVSRVKGLASVPWSINSLFILLTRVQVEKATVGLNPEIYAESPF